MRSNSHLSCEVVSSRQVFEAEKTVPLSGSASTGVIVHNLAQTHKVRSIKHPKTSVFVLSPVYDVFCLLQVHHFVSVCVCLQHCLFCETEQLHVGLELFLEDFWDNNLQSKWNMASFSALGAPLSVQLITAVSEWVRVKVTISAMYNRNLSLSQWHASRWYGKHILAETAEEQQELQFCESW